MKLKREPAVIAAALAAIIQGVLIFTTNDATVDTSSWVAFLIPAVTVVAGFFIRRKVTPVDKS